MLAKHPPPMYPRRPPLQGGHVDRLLAHCSARAHSLSQVPKHTPDMGVQSSKIPTQLRSITSPEAHIRHGDPRAPKAPHPCGLSQVPKPIPDMGTQEHQQPHTPAAELAACSLSCRAGSWRCSTVRAAAGAAAARAVKRALAAARVSAPASCRAAWVATSTWLPSLASHQGCRLGRACTATHCGNKVDQAGKQALMLSLQLERCPCLAEWGGCGPRLCVGAEWVQTCMLSMASCQGCWPNPAYSHQ